ncbi:MAG: CBS domain-containing protein [Gammaproteobacteria bacterium]|nr:CBS domain-containing protein [Gammaproteobacteria bacterium]
MRVDEVMTRTVRTATPETRLEEVAAVMCLNRVSGLPVVDQDECLIGFIAERDILHYLFPTLDDLMGHSGLRDFEQMEQQYGATLGLTVGDVMHRGAVSVPPGTPLLRATSVMVRHKFRRIPVAETDGRLVGIVSIGDIHKALFKHSLIGASRCEAA